MANRAVEMDFSLHLMLSLQCRAPGLLAARPPLPAFSPLARLYFPPSWEGRQEELSLRNLLLRVGVVVSDPTSDLTPEGKMSAYSCVCLGVSPGEAR